MNELFGFDKYAAYILVAYGLTAVVLLVSLIQPLLAKRQLAKRLAHLHQGEHN
jgi:heme exporter protein CcmD